QVIHRDEVTPLLLTELHYSTDIIIRHHYLCFNIRLFNTIDFLRVRHLCRVVHSDSRPVRHGYFIDNRRCCRNQIDSEFPFYPLLYDFHMEETQEPCSETKTDRKSTRLNSSHVSISYAVFCLKKKIRCMRINRSSLLRTMLHM